MMIHRGCLMGQWALGLTYISTGNDTYFTLKMIVSNIDRKRSLYKTTNISPVIIYIDIVKLIYIRGNVRELVFQYSLSFRTSSDMQTLCNEQKHE